MTLVDKLTIIGTAVLLGTLIVSFLIHLSKKHQKKIFDTMSGITVLCVVLLGIFVIFYYPNEKTNTNGNTQPSIFPYLEHGSPPDREISKNDNTANDNTGTEDKKSTTFYKPTQLKDIFEIINKGEILGYVYLPVKAKYFAVYLQDGYKTNEGSAIYLTDIDDQEIRYIERDEFLEKLGRFIEIAKKSGKRLIVTSDDGEGAFVMNNAIKFGKTISTLKNLVNKPMRHPDNGKIYPITGGVEY